MKQAPIHKKPDFEEGGNPRKAGVYTSCGKIGAKTELMEQLHFDFRDIFRVIRYGFSGRKIAVHLIGLLLAYLIYETVVYISLFIVGGNAPREFWNAYALLPVPPLVEAQVEQITHIAMWIGMLSFAGFFFLASTMTSKITIEQLRGDFFFSVGDAATFLKQQWKTVFGAFIGLCLIQIFLAAIPFGIAGLGKLPVVGKPVLMFASLLAPIGFFLGLLMALISVVLIVSLFFVPAVAATTGADAFETIYQQFAIVWNQPWRLLCYETLLFVIKLIFVPIWAFFLPLRLFDSHAPDALSTSEHSGHWLYYANSWLGSAVKKIAGLPYIDNLHVFDMENPAQLPMLAGMEAFWTTATAIFLTSALIMISFLVIAYLFSIASVGNTVIYTILRKRIDGQNLLEPIEPEAGMEPPQIPTAR